MACGLAQYKRPPLAAAVGTMDLSTESCTRGEEGDALDEGQDVDHALISGASVGMDSRGPGQLVSEGEQPEVAAGDDLWVRSPKVAAGDWVTPATLRA